MKKIILFSTMLLLSTCGHLTPVLASCAVVGDSIADMIVPYFKGCDHNVKIGISSAAVLARMPSPAPTFVIVSAGSNDPDNPSLKAHLRAIQAKAPGVIWIVPLVKGARQAVQQVAAERHDETVSYEYSNDGVHPKFPGGVAAAIRQTKTFKNEAAPAANH